MLYQWNVIGHEKELAKIESDFLNGNLHHAYLFVGPEKIGKFRIARSAAGILQCPNNFCHRCPTCIQIEKKCHPDTVELHDNGESIKIGEIREIMNWLNMTTPSRHKILLIENIGRLTPEAANALLKTLEEPSAKSLFFFTASQLRDILPTIASRMRTLHFRKLQDEVLRAALAERFPEISAEMLDEAIILSLGRSGRAIQLLGNPENFRELHELYRHIEFLHEKATPATRFMSTQEISQDPRKMKNFLSLLIHYFRQKLFTETNPVRRREHIAFLETAQKVILLLEKNVNPRLLLEHLMLQL